MASTAVVIGGRPNDHSLGPTGTVGICAERNNEVVVLVDAGDPWNGQELLENLERLGVKNCVTHVVITHGHLDHCANMGLFPAATHIMDSDIGVKHKETCEYSVVPHWPFRISENIEIMKLSGHTASDTILICREQNIFVVFSGDLVEDEQDFHKFQRLQLQLIDGFDNPEDEELMLSQEYIFSSGELIMAEEDEPCGKGLQSSCPICLLELRLRDKVSALNCGHVFHFGCINQWLAAKKQCPSCRKVVPRSGFIEKLYFNVVSGAEGDNPMAQIDYEEEASRLTAALAAEKEKHSSMDEENKKLKVSVKSLEKKVLKEKDRTRHEIPRLEAIVDNLKIVADEVPHLQREVTEYKNKLKATEFYQVLHSYENDADKKLKEYLKKNGSLDTEKFFEMMKARNKDLLDKWRQSRQTIEKLTDENSSLRKSLGEKDSAITTLKSTVLELRDRANVKTPMPKRVQKVIDDVPVKRVSMGFDDTIPAENDVMNEFTKENNIPSTSKEQIPPHLDPFSFDSDEEYFTVPKTVERKKKEEKMEQQDSNDFSFDIDVPPTIVNRIPAIRKIAPVIPRRSSDQNAKSLNSKPLNRSCSTPVNLIKPNIVKRKLSDDSKPTKQNSKPPAVKSARLSSFYQRIPSKSSGLNIRNDDDLITLD